MTESGTDSTTITWSAPECPFRIEASARVLDDIRLAVTDAFFSLPRGGAEIGGILLGVFENGRLVISDYASLDCEHAFGPSFTLSPPDETRLTELLATHSNGAGGPRPVGWYHSHTRSEVFLSDVDVEIHRRFFPEPWQVALVIKPHTFQPARIGFFFREADGSVHATASYREDVLDALPVRQMPAGPPPAEFSHEPQPRNLRQSEVSGPVLEVVAELQMESARTGYTPSVEPAMHVPAPPPSVLTFPAVAPPPSSNPPVATYAAHATTQRDAAEADAPLPAPAGELPTPKFVIESESSARKWMMATIGVVAVLGVAGAGFKTREMWLPRVLAAARPAPKVVTPVTPPALGLSTIDREGQLQINWDRNSDAVRSATDALLEINEGGPVPTAIQLDSAHLQTGAFTYARTAEKVDVKLILHHKGAADLREATSFLGKLPERKPVADPETDKQRDEAAKQAAKLKADLAVQAAKTKKLERDVQSMRDEMRKQQQRRMANQLPGK